MFWVAFLTLNLLLFLPLFVLTWESPARLSADPMPLGMGMAAPLTLLQHSGDLFRLNLELTLLVALAVFVRPLWGAPYRVLVALFYLVALAYYVYEGVTLAVYNAEPIFYNQLYLYAEGLPFLLQHARLSPLLYLALSALLGLGIAGIFWLVRTMLDDARLPRLSRWTRLAVGALALVLLTVTVGYRSALASPDMVVSSLGYKLHRNATQSLTLRASSALFDDRPARVAYESPAPRLLQKPDVYLIFVESYGSVLYKRDDYRILYTQLLDELDEQLAADGWSAASALSTSPTWGGGSWLAYTSALFGMRIDNHPQFLTLFSKYQQVDYPHLGRFLRAEGYDFSWLTSIATELSESKWSQYQRFYGTDHWYRHGDLDYVGREYSWGPAPPDQYSFNYVRALIRERTDDPILLFYITQTSHYPWTDLPEVVDDWRALNVTPENVETAAIDPDEMAHATRRSNYMRAIDYELRVLVNAILREEEDAIFVLIGDHQPPRVSKRADGFETPVHIISRDAAFLDEFVANGFTPGLIAPDLDSDMRHEGFYSLFRRALLSRYGDASGPLPPYLPNGVLTNMAEGGQ